MKMIRSSRSTVALFAVLTFTARPAFAAGEGADFTAEARLLIRVLTCADDSPLPAGIDAEVVATHCRLLRVGMETYRAKYVDRAMPFLQKLTPAGLPDVVVYPFGGGDLLSALTTYPNAVEVTTMSLEHAGDPRRINDITKQELEESLALIRETIAGLLTLDDSKSVNLSKGQRGDIPGQLAFFLVALAVHGYEPVGLRYFRLEKDGSIDYLDAEEIAALEKKTASKLKSGWTPPDFSAAFSHAELRFEKKGGGGPVRVHRHIAQNLADGELTKDPSLLLHLSKKGKVSAMTKAASYLLWMNSFSKIRGYLLENMVFMISDSTGIPVAYATKAGFQIEPYGRFESSFLEASPRHNSDLKKLYDKGATELPFRYGYPDSKKRYHMMVTRRP